MNVNLSHIYLKFCKFEFKEFKWDYDRVETKIMVYLVHLLQETLVSQKQVRHMFYFSMTMIHSFLINMKQEIFYWIEYIEWFVKTNKCINYTRLKITEGISLLKWSIFWENFGTVILINSSILWFEISIKSFNHTCI